MMANIRNLEVMIEEVMLAYIEEHGSFEEGGVRYYAGDQKKTTVIDKERAIEAVLGAVGGDLSEFVEALGAQPLKTGACRSILGEAFDEHFKTEVVPRLKEGKPQKRVIAVEGKYLDK
jgi:hypothetical protein